MSGRPSRELPPAPSDLPIAVPGGTSGQDARQLIEMHVASMADSISKVTSLLKRPGVQLERPSCKRAAPVGESSPHKMAKTGDDPIDDDTGVASVGGLDLLQLRDQLRAFAVERDWDQFHTPRNICLALVGEVGELAECFQWKGDAGAATGLPDWTEAKKEHLGEECADVLLYLVRLADKCGIDLPTVAMRKIQKNATKYPASLVRGSAKKYNEYS